MLGAAVLHHHHDAGRNVGDADRHSVLLTCWPPAPCARMVSIRRSSCLDVDIDVLYLRQHRHRRRRGVNAALRLGVGHALDPVHAEFEFQLGERAAAPHLGDDFLVAAHGAFAGGDHLDLPALQGGETLIHPEQVAGKKRGLVAAGAGADFQHHVAIVHRVLGQQRHADLLRQFDAARAERLALGLRHARAFRARSRDR